MTPTGSWVKLIFALKFQGEILLPARRSSRCMGIGARVLDKCVLYSASESGRRRCERDADRLGSVLDYSCGGAYFSGQRSKLIDGIRERSEAFDQRTRLKI